MTAIASLPLHCGFNVGGIRHLQIIGVDQVLDIATAINSIVENAITLVAGAEVAVIQFPPSGGDFNETDKEGDVGTIVQSRIRVDIPRDAPELGHWANTNSEREVIALYQDENGVAVIVGDLERPLSIKILRNTGRRPTDKNDYTLTLEGVSDHYAYYYQMFELGSPGHRKVYSAGYTFGYQRT